MPTASLIQSPILSISLNVDAMSAQNHFSISNSNPKIKIFSLSPAKSATRPMIYNLPRIKRSMLFLFLKLSIKTCSIKKLKIPLSFSVIFMSIKQFSINANMKETIHVLCAFLNI